jgi:hypothetical protein
MNERYGLNRWIVGVIVAAVLVAAVVGAVTYNLGVAHGLALSGQVPVAAPGAYYPYGPYGWYHPWGFGFGFFTPFLFFVFWVLVFRALFWGGRWRRHRYYVGPREMPQMFDEWHRRAHDRMKSEPPATV